MVKVFQKITLLYRILGDKVSDFVRLEIFLAIYLYLIAAFGIKNASILLWY